MAYSEDQIGEALAVLDANEGAVRKTQRDLQGAGWDTVPSPSTIRRWREKRSDPATERDHACAKNGTQKKEALAARLDSAAHQLIGVIESVEVDGNATPKEAKEAATALGIAIDKLQLLEGEATSISERRGNADLNIEQLNQQNNLTRYESRLFDKYE